MTAVSPWNRILTKLWASLKSQWLASTLLIPLAFLIYSNHVQREAAKEDRLQALNVDRVSKIQDSGKALDLALAAYFQSIADLGLAERSTKMPIQFDNVPLKQAKLEVVDRRNEARKALAEHGSDVQRLRGTLNEQESARYMGALADISGTIEGQPDINKTGANITALSKLVVARNALVDHRMKSIG